MRNYVVQTPLRGFRRRDGEAGPIGVDEVVALPDAIARNLIGLQAVQPTEAEETCVIDWSPRRAATTSGGIDAGDVKELVAAIDQLGGIVFFPGEGLPDDAALALADFSNLQLFDELAVRLSEGRLSLAEVPAQLQRPAPIAMLEVAGDGSGETLPPIEQGTPPAGETIQSGQDGAGEAASGNPPAIETASPTVRTPRKAKAK